MDTSDQMINHEAIYKAPEETNVHENNSLGLRPSESSTKTGGGFCDRIVKDQQLRHKFLHTVCVCLSRVAVGWRLAITGPTLPDLRLIMNENLSRASWIISALSFGELLGSLSMGAIYDKFNKRLIFMALTLCLSVFTVVTPWCSSFAAMVAIHVFNGICTHGITTVASADVALVWSDNRAPFLQAINFAFSIGAILSPLVSAPFLARRHLQDSNTNTETEIPYTAAYNESSIVQNTTNFTHKNEYLHEQMYGDTHVHWAYVISASFSIMTSMGFVVDFVLFKNVYDSDEGSKRKGTTSKSLSYPLKKTWQTLFVLLISVMCSVYISSERLLYNYLFTFLTERFIWSTRQASSATTLFWVAFASGRLLSVYVVIILKPYVVFSFCLGLMLTACVIFLLAVRCNIHSLVWLACICYGMGLSAMLGNIIAWISEKVCPLTGKVCSFVYTVMILGTIISPLIAGNLMSTVSYDWFVYIELILTALTIVLYVVAEMLYSRTSKTPAIRTEKKIRLERIPVNTSSEAI